MKIHSYRYGSITDYLTAVQAESSLSDAVRSSRSKGRNSWTLTESFEEAISLASNGWPEGAVKAKEYALQITGRIGALGYVKEWRAQVYGGGTLLVNDFIEGRPDCYSHLKKRQAPKFLRVVVNGSASAKITTESMIIRGAMASALCDLLEVNGYRVQVDLVFCTTNQKDTTFDEFVTLKNYNESIDLDRIAFFTAHPSSLRRLCLSWKECLPEHLRKKTNVPGNYGYPENPEDRGDIYFPRMGSWEPQWESAESAARFLKQLLKDKGIVD